MTVLSFAREFAGLLLIGIKNFPRLFTDHNSIFTDHPWQSIKLAMKPQKSISPSLLDKGQILRLFTEFKVDFRTS